MHSAVKPRGLGSVQGLPQTHSCGRGTPRLPQQVPAAFPLGEGQPSIWVGTPVGASGSEIVLPYQLLIWVEALIKEITSNG